MTPVQKKTIQDHIVIHNQRTGVVIRPMLRGGDSSFTFETMARFII